jgi:large subunit ribosomal protein L25
MKQIEFTAFARNTEGRGASRRMRRAGKAPGIVYGGTIAPTPIELDHNALFHALRGEAFHSSILTMKLDGTAAKVLLRDVQMHPFRNEILHVDFQRVDENKKIHMKVPLHFIKGEDSPAVKLSAAIISHVTTDLDIACLPKDLPGFIEVDLSALEVGHALHVSSVKLPPGVSVVKRGRNDPVVAAAIVPRAQVETEEETAAAAAAATAAAAAVPEGDAKAADDKGGDKKDDKKDVKKDDKKK